MKILSSKLPPDGMAQEDLKASNIKRFFRFAFCDYDAIVTFSTQT